MIFSLLSFKNRHASTGIVQKITFEAMAKAFKSNVIRTQETVFEYRRSDRNFQLKCKDKGGFIAGESRYNRRDNISMLSRNMITLDLDYCPANIFEIIKQKHETGELNFKFFVYTTHSHTPEKPRLRVVVPLSKPVALEQYEPIARAIAVIIGFEFFDATTFQVNRIMYFPSVSIDGEYRCEIYGLDTHDFLNPDDMLDKYMNYLDINEFQKPHYIDGLKINRIEEGKTKDATKTKFRIVNAFNTTYTIEEAIDRFLTEEYTKGHAKGRYTYINGESKDGLVILSPQYAYSHHATDPAQGRLLHAFDIVRIHKFGKKDNDKSDQYTEEKYNQSQSFMAMTDFIRDNLPEVMRFMPEIQKITKSIDEFHKGEIINEPNSPEAGDWRLNLDYIGSEKDRHPKSNARNLKLIFENDDYFKDMFYYDGLKDAICFDRVPAWNKEKERGDMLTDDDDSEIRTFLNATYEIAGKDLIYDAVVHQANKKRRHPIKAFFANLPDWDKKPRIETIFCELFAIEPNAYYKEASKSWWCGLVQRIMRAGSKYDLMVVFSGEQGIGKSQLGKSIATLKWGGDMPQIDSQPNFYSDDELPFDKKDAYEQLGGIMIYELPEFEKYYKKSDTSTIKSFLSKTSDKYRKSYGRRVAEYRRQCVFIATTNDKQPLRDRTGNRRFLPFYSTLPAFTSRVYDKNYWTEDIRNQCLAEALYYFNGGYNPMTNFSAEAQRIWNSLNEQATIDNDSLPIVEKYVNTAFPLNYFRFPLNEMREIYNGIHFQTNNNKPVLEKRDEISIKEIYCVAFERDLSKTPDFLIREQIESALDKLGFIKQAYRRSQGVFGQQVIYKRVNESKLENDEEEVDEDDLPF